MMHKLYLMSVIDPVKVVTVLASILPVVFPSSVFRADAAVLYQLNVTASFPNPEIPDDA